MLRNPEITWPAPSTASDIWGGTPGDTCQLLEKGMSGSGTRAACDLADLACRLLFHSIVSGAARQPMQVICSVSVAA